MVLCLNLCIKVEVILFTEPVAKKSFSKNLSEVSSMIKYTELTSTFQKIGSVTYEVNLKCDTVKFGILSAMANKVKKFGKQTYSVSLDTDYGWSYSKANLF